MKQTIFSCVRPFTQADVLDLCICYRLIKTPTYLEPEMVESVWCRPDSWCSLRTNLLTNLLPTCRHCVEVEVLQPSCQPISLLDIFPSCSCNIFIFLLFLASHSIFLPFIPCLANIFHTFVQSFPYFSPPIHNNADTTHTFCTHRLTKMHLKIYIQ